MKLRLAELVTPTLVDRMNAEMLDHLIACRTCSAIFAAQKHSLGETECAEGQRIASESRVNQQNRRPDLAIRHLTEEILDDYIFDRLASDERQTLE